MLNAWSGNVQANVTRLAIARCNWNDAVFGGLIKEWLDIFRRAFDGASPLMDYMPNIPLDNQPGSQWSKACDWLESHCMKTYEDILKSGFDHLKDIGMYSNWGEVVVANEPRPMIF
jgi:hypothetical protein